ncbi:hypothetical protein AB0N17_46705 [Streptomyces sp. NPDC051133]|uniref:hypothetical protein n=1 Tax=Streptomyces sp. NPDC051133 TaxID=3155521 RepID=UPI00341A0325
MRVAIRAKTPSRRARWGARFIAAGLTTATTVGITASPASAAAVEPMEVLRASDCSSIGLDPASFEFEDDEGVGNFDSGPIQFSPPHDDGAVEITGNDPFSPTNITFNITGPYAARAVIVYPQGLNNSANAYVYDTTTFPHGLAFDTGLENPDEGFITNVAFCVTSDPYNTGG